MFSLQFTLVFPFRSIAWRALSVSTSKGISCTIPNWRTTRSDECFSTSQKHTSGNLIVHISLPAKQNTSKWPNSASYGCHTAYNSHTKKKDSTLCNIPLFSTMRYFTFITVYTIHKHYKKHNLGTYLECIESKSSWYRAKQISARLFFVLTTHSHLQLRKRESVSTNYAMITQYNWVT